MKRKITTLRYLGISLVVLMGIFVLHACDDACDDVVCINGTKSEDAAGNCQCVCNTGFSGVDCSVEDSCITQNVTCLNGGTCVDGSCDCVVGYEGDSCETESRIVFFGNYFANDVCDSAGTITAYTVDIGTNPANVAGMIITSSFSDDFFVNNINATVTASAAFEIPLQEPDGDDFFVEGSGTISGSTLTINYVITERDPNNSNTILDTDACTGTWDKQ